MADPKHTPYRERGAIEERRGRRGKLVTRAEPPEEAPRAATSPRTRSRDRADPDAGVFAGLLTPHPSSSSTEAWTQIALTAIGMPIVVFSFVILANVAFRMRVLGHSGGFGMGHPLVWVLGAAQIAGLGYLLELPLLAIAATAGIPLAALFIRRRVRDRIEEREAFLATMRRAR